MLVEDVFESLRTETHIAITLEELSSVPATCLRAFDHLLKKLESSRHNFKASEGEARAKEAHLVDAIEHLTEQNAILQTRLIASLDALSAVSNDALDKSKEDIEALRLLNQNLALRLHDAARENTELRECLDSYSEPSRLVNNPVSIRRSQYVANEHISTARALHDTQQDGDGISDAETEVQAHYTSIRDQQDANALRGAEQPEQVRLRTRTILLELANELEMSRQEIGSLQAEKDKAVSLLQSQVDSRNKELGILYRQLDKFFGLPGFALTRSRHQDKRKGQSHAEEGLQGGAEMAQILQSQLQDLKRDIERLSAERDNIARYGLGAPWHDVRYQSTQANVEEPISVAAAQEASFEAVAKRAREKLEEQENQINSLKSELSRAQESLQSPITHQDDVFSVSHALDERLLAGATMPRPRSAFADPHAGSHIFRESLPRPPEPL